MAVSVEKNIPEVKQVPPDTASGGMVIIVALAIDGKPSLFVFC